MLLMLRYINSVLSLPNHQSLPAGFQPAKIMARTAPESPEAL